MDARTLIVMRHGKSDWTVPASDRERPLTGRGRRQAAEAGRWLAAHADRPDLAVVSPAVRAAHAWQLAAAELSSPPPVRFEELAYTFDGTDLVALVRSLDEQRTVVIVGHNPACEELVELLSAEPVQLTTSALAVLELDGWGGRGRLLDHGRPPPGRAAGA